MDVQMIQKLPKEHRKTFILLLLLVLVLLFWMDSSLTPEQPKILILQYVRQVASAIVVTLLVLWVVSALFPPLSKRDELVEIEPKRITAEFDSLLESATRWRYKGNFGRYMRSKVLSTLAPRKNMHVMACIIDPANEALCAKHAEYRSQIHAIDRGTRYDSNKVALEVLVTIVICAWYVINRRIRIDLYLSPVFDPVRIDANDDAMILTVEDRRSPALKVKREHFTYDHFDLQMEFSRTQARVIQLGGVRQGIALGDLNAADVEGVLRGAELDGLLRQHSAHQILQACRESKNPYET
jgi:hypothetical protein